MRQISARAPGNAGIAQLVDTRPVPLSPVSGLVELAVTGYVAMLAYVVMKTCEHALSHWLADTSPFAPSVVDDERAPSESEKKH